MRAWVDAWLQLLRPRRTAWRLAQMQIQTERQAIQTPAMPLTDGWIEAAFIATPAPVAKRPCPPDLLLPGNMAGFAKASERTLARVLPRHEIPVFPVVAAPRMPEAPAAPTAQSWVEAPKAPGLPFAAVTPTASYMPGITVTPIIPDAPTARISPIVTAAPIRKTSGPGKAAKAKAAPVVEAPRAAPSAPTLPIERVMSLLVDASTFQGLEADAYREHIAIKTQVIGTDAPAEAAPAATPKPRRIRLALARIGRHAIALPLTIASTLQRGFMVLARGLFSGIKSGIRTIASGAKKALGKTGRGLKATGSGIKTATLATARGMRKAAIAVFGATAFAAAVLAWPLVAARAVAAWRPRFGGKEGNGILAAAVPFQPDIDEIIEEPAPHAMRSLHYFIVALFAALLLIAALVKVEIVVQGSGQLTTETAPIVLQPMERGIIREIKVKVGDIVQKGQVLAALDPTFSNADVGSLKAQNRALAAQLRRIEAEMTGKPFVVNEVGDPHEDLQAALYLQRQSQYNARLRAFDEELGRWDSNIKATIEERNSLQQQLGIANEVESMRTELWQGRLTSKLQYLNSQNTRLKYQRDYQAAVEKLTELQHNLDGKRAERQAFTDEWRRQLLEELLNKRTELTKINEALSKAARLHDMVLLIAPEDGVVLDVARRSVGSVMREAEPLVTLVPSNAKLIAEIMVGSGDVGYAAPGDRVVVKVDAFPYQRHGLMEGRLMSISEESFNPGRTGATADGSPIPSVSGAQHRARIALTNMRLEKMPESARLIPGMTLSAEIMVGKRSVISYFLNPITRGFSESIREP